MQLQFTIHQVSKSKQLIFYLVLYFGCRDSVIVFGITLTLAVLFMIRRRRLNEKHLFDAVQLIVNLLNAPHQRVAPFKVDDKFGVVRYRRKLIFFTKRKQTMNKLTAFLGNCEKRHPFCRECESSLSRSFARFGPAVTQGVSFSRLNITITKIRFDLFPHRRFERAKRKGQQADALANSQEKGILEYKCGHNDEKKRVQVAKGEQ